MENAVRAYSGISETCSYAETFEAFTLTEKLHSPYHKETPRKIDSSTYTIRLRIGEKVDEYEHKEGTTIFITVGLFFDSQETEGQKTNNGIQYRLQLLYANGK